MLGPGRSIVRERDPAFDASFIESCLLIVGSVADVWGGYFDDSTEVMGGSSSSVFARQGDMEQVHSTQQHTANMDMLSLLVARGHRKVRTRVSAREAFR